MELTGEWVQAHTLLERINRFNLTLPSDHSLGNLPTPRQRGDSSQKAGRGVQGCFFRVKAAPCDVLLLEATNIPRTLQSLLYSQTKMLNLDQKMPPYLGVGMSHNQPQKGMTNTWVTEVCFLIHSVDFTLCKLSLSLPLCRAWRSLWRSASSWASTACCRHASSPRMCKCCVSWRATKPASTLWTSERTEI